MQERMVNGVVCEMGCLDVALLAMGDMNNMDPRGGDRGWQGLRCLDRKRRGLRCWALRVCVCVRGFMKKLRGKGVGACRGGSVRDDVCVLL